MKTICNPLFAFLLATLVFSTPSTFGKNEKYVPPPISLKGKESTVARYLINPFGEVDGLFLDDGTLVSLPPHMSADVADLVKPGDAISLSGKPEGESGFEAYSVTHIGSDQTLLRRKPAWNGKVMPKALRLAELRELSVSGKIERVITGKRGEPKIVVLENGTNIRLSVKSPSSVPFDAGAPLRAGEPFAAKGAGSETPYGSSLEASAIGTSPASLKPLVSSGHLH